MGKQVSARRPGWERLPKAAETGCEKILRQMLPLKATLTLQKRQKSPASVALRQQRAFLAQFTVFRPKTTFFKEKRSEKRREKDVFLPKKSLFY
jgi:hypothetical protein